MTDRHGGAGAASSPTAPVLVIGATGRVGRAVVAELQALGRPVRALSRRPAAAAFARDVELFEGDLTVPESLDRALAGVGAVLLVWTAPAATVSAAIARLARSAERIVFLSSPHRTPHPFFRQPNAMAELHASIEQHIAASGVASTIVRPGMFAANTIAWWSEQIRTRDVVRWPYASVETAPIDERDIAAVAARALCDAGHAGRDYVVTGPTSITQAQQVHAIGDALGRRLVLDELTPDEFRRDTAGKAPSSVVEMLLAAWGAAEGHAAHVTSTVTDVVGVPARTFDEWAAANVDSFRR